MEGGEVSAFEELALTLLAAWEAGMTAAKAGQGPPEEAARAWAQDHPAPPVNLDAVLQEQFVLGYRAVTERGVRPQ
jgi:hypothetical protein